MRTEVERCAAAIYYANVAAYQVAVVFKAAASIGVGARVATLDPSSDVLTIGDHWVLLAEVDHLKLLLAHVAKAADRSDGILPQHPDAELMRFLRNYSEHWEEVGSAAKRLEQLRPSHMIEPMTILPRRFILNGMDSGELIDWVRSVDKAARARLRTLDSTSEPPVWSAPMAAQTRPIAP